MHEPKDNVAGDDKAKNKALPEVDDKPLVFSPDIEQIDLDDEAVEETGAEDKDAQADKPSSDPSKPSPTSSRNPLHRLKAVIVKHKKWSALVALLVVLVILAGVPYTRYKIAGLALKKQAQVVVTDSTTGKPVTNALVKLDGRTILSDNQGKVGPKLAVGPHKVTISKKYYQSYNGQLFVGLKGQSGLSVKLTATGRQMPISVINKISGQPVANALVKVQGTEDRTDKDGKVTIVVPTRQIKALATVTAEGYNSATLSVTVTDQVLEANNVRLTPAGKLYFLSKKSGKIDVVKTNLDGSERQVVLAGSGTEDDRDTVLLASRDWHYLALKSKREGGNQARLFLIDTTTDKLTTIDDGKATVNAVGWFNEFFVYSTYNDTIQNWQSGREVLRSYNAKTQKTAMLDRTDATGSNAASYANEGFSSIYLVPSGVVYGKFWNHSYPDGSLVAGKKASINTVQADGANKLVLKDFDASKANGNVGVIARIYEPQGIYFGITKDDGVGNNYFEVEDSKVTAKALIEDEFNRQYATYLVSPNSQQTFWYEQRDGKNTLFVGDAKGATPQQLADLSEYAPYGWYSDNYLLVSKNGSELYILPRQLPAKAAKLPALKVTDYHKPTTSLAGYGYGYGGL